MVCPSTGAEYYNDQPTLEMKDLYFSHPKDCNSYLSCDLSGNMSVLECLNGTHFSPYYQSCVHPSVANCKKYQIMDDTPLNFSLKSLLLNNLNEKSDKNFSSPITNPITSTRSDENKQEHETKSENDI